MILKRTSILLLISMILAVLEMTVNPEFHLGRIFLVVSSILLVAGALWFVKDNYRIAPKAEKIKK
ncbi:hypothetical protein [Companilactobacillus nodensis]|uniref:Uncharacterized protein n=1 Tax=Companilactobacillus nodensis DSM 19682 = JCM 14932 = NBRC 107160 TaxID=1423775 RepID=A0A0R1K5Q9_9LACO|nr:hypothetical protein [Companilactobacillus nodensis]KRK78925.1 hypothetical protein FD03_GL001284 [Companilactobacillus nodensis DSM 19682 = JCM 14932 = NBRC 107160]